MSAENTSWNLRTGLVAFESNRTAYTRTETVRTCKPSQNRQTITEHANHHRTCKPAQNMQTSTTCKQSQNMQTSTEHANHHRTCKSSQNMQTSTEHANQHRTCKPAQNMQTSTEHANHHNMQTITTCKPSQHANHHSTCSNPLCVHTLEATTIVSLASVLPLATNCVIKLMIPLEIF